jgi:phenylalanyl-tRNA synthetase beta chain
MLGIEVESITDNAQKYDKFFVAHVISKEKHPQADKLSLCEVDYGHGKNTVVCGAPNVAAGQKIAFASLGALVPGGGFKIEKRKIRGVESCGMICAQTELEHGDDSSGIWVLPEDAPVGAPLAKYLEIDDVILEISVTPNRPDCINHFGLAREIAAYKNVKFQAPDVSFPMDGKNAAEQIKIDIQAPELCPKYTGMILNGVKVCESPEWLKNRIIALGLRPLNAIVDVTNYVMFETGQPLHAFDLNKLSSSKIIVRTAAAGEKFTTLDDKEREMPENALMICDGEKAIAAAGVMGGANSEISNDTCDILIESAYFNPSSVRRTSKKLQLQTDASYRFERGVDYQGVEYASNYAAKLILEICGGKAADKMIVCESNPIVPATIELRFQKTRDIIGVDIKNEDMIKFLSALEFTISDINEDKATVVPPSYRVDINLEIDVVEEIARMYDYDNIDPQFSANVSFNSNLAKSGLAMPPQRAQIRNYFVQNGFMEILTQNIVSPAMAKAFTETPITIANPLGEEMSVMRPSMIPSMLKTIERNIRYGSTDLCLFEIGKTFNPAGEKEKSFIPGIKETEELVVALSGCVSPFNWSDKQRKADYYDIKGVFEDLMDRFDKNTFKLVKDDYLSSMFSGSALTVMYKGEVVGKFGECSASALKAYDISANVFLFVLNLEKFYVMKTASRKYQAVSPFPSVKRDLGFVMDSKISAGDVKDAIVKCGGNFLKEVEIFDVYEGEKLGEGKKNIAFSLEYLAKDKTLTDEDVDSSIKNIIQTVSKNFDAKLREF